MPKNTTTITIRTHNRENILEKIETLKAAVAEHMAFERDVELKNQLEALLAVAQENIDKYGFTHPDSGRKHSPHRGFELNPNQLFSALNSIEKTIKKFNVSGNATPSGDDTQENHYARLNDNLDALQKSFNYRVTPEYLKSKKRKDYIYLSIGVGLLAAAAAGITAVLVLFGPGIFAAMPAVGAAVFGIQTHLIVSACGLVLLGALDFLAISSIPKILTSVLSGHKTLANKIAPNPAIDKQLKDSGMLTLIDKIPSNESMKMLREHVEKNAGHKAGLIEAEIQSTDDHIQAYEQIITSMIRSIKDNVDCFEKTFSALNAKLDRVGYTADIRFQTSPHGLINSIKTTEALLNELTTNNSLALINNAELKYAHNVAVTLAKELQTFDKYQNNQALLNQKNEALKIKLRQLRDESYAARKCEKYQKEGRVDIKEKDNNRFAARRIQGDDIGRFTFFSKKVNQHLHQLAVAKNQIRAEDFVLEPVKLKK